MSSLIRLVFVVALGAAATVRAADDVTDPYDKYRAPGESESRGFDFDESLIEPWKEQQTSIPVLSEEGLQRIRIDHGPPGLTYYLDLDTLTVDEKDRVARYWVVMESRGRRTNVLYEGVKCTDLEYKTYAYASPVRISLIKHVKSPRWERIGAASSNDFRRELAEQYLCSLGSARSVNGIARAAKGFEDVTNPNNEDADFMPK